MYLQIQQALEKLHFWYERALELGELCLDGNEENLVRYTDERNRILNKIGEIQGVLKSVFEGAEYQKLPPSQQAQINEKKAQIKDLLPQFHNQMRKFYRHFHPRLVDRRGNLVEFNTRSRAISAYVRSPGYQVA